MTRSKLTSMLALVSYVLAVLVSPVLHRLHHLAHGADHVHTAAGTIYFGHHDDHDEDEDEDEDDHDHDHDDHDHDDHDHDDHEHHHHAPEDAHHGDGSLEHTQASYLCSAPVVLPPPVSVFAHRELLVPSGVSSIGLLALPPIRGPPRTT